MMLLVAVTFLLHLRQLRPPAWLMARLRLPRLQTWAVQGPFLLLLTAQYCLHVSCAARIFWCEPLLGVGAEAPRSGW